MTLMETVSPESRLPGELTELELPATRAIAANFTEYDTAGEMLVIAGEGADIMRAARRIELTGERFNAAISAHQVAFGRAVGVKANRRVGTLTGVAVKHVKSFDAALAEARGYELLASLGVETFSPTAVLDDPEHGAFVLTRRRSDFASLDQDEWIRSMEPVTEHEAEVLEKNKTTIREVSELAAWLHLNGVFVPDGQIKNWAVTTTGVVGAIDPERLVHVDLHDQRTAELMWDDLLHLYKSLRVDNVETDGLYGIGLLKGKSLGQIRQCFEMLTLESYLDALNRYLEQIKLSRSEGTYKTAIEQTNILLGALSAYEERLKEVDCF